MERGIRKIFTFVKLYIAPKLFGKIMLKPCNFEKFPCTLRAVVSPGRTLRYEKPLLAE